MSLLGRGEADSFCWKDCASGGDCRSGYGCYPLSTGGACWLSPLPAFDAGPPADKVGATCTLDTDCDNPPDYAYAYCISPTTADGGPSGYPSGYCTADCSYNGQPMCGALGLCLADPYGVGVDLCFRRCASAWAGQSTCRSGYRCYGYVNADGGKSSDGFCEASCNNAGNPCPQGSYCDAGYCL